MRKKIFNDSLEAWEKINEAFIKGEKGWDIIIKNKALYLYDLVIEVANPRLPQNFDFGRHFNYTISKWNNLIGNYINKPDLQKIKSWVSKEEEKNNKVYNIPLSFDNKHGHGKSCLLSMVFSRRMGDVLPSVVVFLRASEITKRLICDLLLFQRVGEYIYGEDDFKLVIHFNQVFNDDTVLLMYDVHRDIKSILGSVTNSDRKRYLLERLEYLKSCNPDDIKYKVHKRALKVLRPDLFKYPKTLVRDCKLHITE